MKPKTKAQTKAGASAVHVPGGVCGGHAASPDEVGKLDAGTAALLAEMDRELAAFKTLVKLEDGCDEMLASLAQRLQTKGTTLANKVNKKAGGDNSSILDTLTSAKTQLQGIIDAVKAALVFVKNRAESKQTPSYISFTV